MIQLCILDYDSRYAETLTNFLSVKYGSQIDPKAFLRLEELTEYLAQQRADFVLAGTDALPNPDMLPQNVAVAYLSDDRSVEQINGRPAIFRYQRGEALLRQIRGVAAEYDQSQIQYATAGNGNRTVFMGVGGGYGCTTAAIGYAVQAARRGRRTLYLNLQNNGLTESVLSGEGSGNMSRVLYEVKTYRSKREGQGNLAVRLESIMKYDSKLRLYYFDAFSLPIEAASMTAEELICLLSVMSDTFEVVVADMDGACTPQARAAMDQAKQVVLVTDGSEEGWKRLKKMVDAFEILDQNEDAKLLPRTWLLCSCDTGKAPQKNETRVRPLPVIQKERGLTGRQAVERIGQGDEFLALLR